MRKKSKNLVILCGIICLASCGNRNRENQEEEVNQEVATLTTPEIQPVEEEPDPGSLWRAQVSGQEITQPLVVKALSETELPGVTIRVPEPAQIVQNEIEDQSKYDEQRAQGEQAQQEQNQQNTPNIGSYLINNNVGFALMITKQAPDLAQARQTASQTEGFVRFVREEDNLIVYEVRGAEEGTSHFSFVSVREIAGNTYGCMSHSETTFSEMSLVEQMIEACGSLSATPEGQQADTASAGQAVPTASQAIPTTSQAAPTASPAMNN